MIVPVNTFVANWTMFSTIWSQHFAFGAQEFRAEILIKFHETNDIGLLNVAWVFSSGNDEK